MTVLRIPDETLIAREMARTGLDRRHCIGRIQSLAAMQKAARKAWQGRFS